MKAVSMLFAIVSLTVSNFCSASVIFNQIDAWSKSTDQGWASQFFEPGLANFNVVAIDDFSVSGGQGQLTTVETVMGGFNGFTSFANVTNWTVQIYTSVSAAVGNLVGDAGSAQNLSATITQVGINNFLISLDVNGSINLPDGDYWVAVMPHMAFNTGGQLAVRRSLVNDGPIAVPNAFMVNPGGGFGFGSFTQIILDGIEPVNLAYRITAIPAPGSLALIGLAICAWRRRAS